MGIYYLSEKNTDNNLLMRFDPVSLALEMSIDDGNTWINYFDQFNLSELIDTGINNIDLNSSQDIVSGTIYSFDYDCYLVSMITKLNYSNRSIKLQILNNDNSIQMELLLESDPYSSEWNNNGSRNVITSIYPIKSNIRFKVIKSQAEQSCKAYKTI